MRKPPFARAVSGLGRPPERARHCSRRIRHGLAPGAAWDTPQHRLDPARGRQHTAETPQPLAIGERFEVLYRHRHRLELSLTAVGQPSGEGKKGGPGPLGLVASAPV